MDEDVGVETAAVFEDFPAELADFAAILVVDVLEVKGEVTFEVEEAVAFWTFDGLFEAFALVLFAGAGGVVVVFFDGRVGDLVLFLFFFFDYVLFVEIFFFKKFEFFD